MVYDSNTCAASRLNEIDWTPVFYLQYVNSQNKVVETYYKIDSWWKPEIQWSKEYLTQNNLRINPTNL